LGGLSKKAYQLEKIRSLHKLPTLTLDAGNLLFKQESLPPAMLEQAMITAEAITGSYNLMQYDAVAVGKNDLAAGISFLEKQAGRSNFIWLSANLVRRSTGKPVFPATIVRQVGNIRVGVIGLTDNDANNRLHPDEDAIILPWQDILPDLAAELSSQCDMLILLSNYPMSRNLEIINSLAKVHLVILSSPRSGNSTPQLVNKSLLVQTGKQGKYLGWMLIDWQESKTWGHDETTRELATRKQELDGINGRISRFERKLTPKDLAANTSYQNLLVARDEVLSKIVFLENEQKIQWGYEEATRELATRKQELDGINGRISRFERKIPKEDLAANTSYQNLLTARDEVLSKIVFLENEQKIQQDAGRSPSTFENYFLTLDVALPDQPDVKQIVETAKLKVNEAGRNKTTGKAGSTSLTEISIEKLAFTGWKTCAQCHLEQTDFWKKTSHFSAYNTLVENEQQFNLACLPCHVTAEYDTAKINGDDALLLSLPSFLQQVGCEICHGPGKSHAVSQDPAAISRLPPAVICLRCHTPERDEDFNYDNDVERIACPAAQ
jgi:hypothetical protein